jgi:hypothetical protein
MSDMPLPRITELNVLSDFKLLLAWDMFPKAIVDLSQTIAQGGVFATLRDEGAFAKVRIGERGRTIEWPNPTAKFGYPLIDIDAESLHMMSISQRRKDRITQAFDLLRGIIEKVRPSSSPNPPIPF